jgi:hypothetical protein
LQQQRAELARTPLELGALRLALRNPEETRCHRNEHDGVQPGELRNPAPPLILRLLLLLLLLWISSSLLCKSKNWAI